ncbi:MAG: cadmium-translocating P-type ATPase, partial [Clostridia bacterium]|nr:cadmium-translocating P-type ATPase [Clostridia bacterium]
MTHKQKKQLIRIGVSIALLIVAALLPWAGWLRLVAFAIPYLFIGWKILWRSLRNIARGQVFDENFLMSIATLGAFAIGEYAEGCFVMIFYQLGEWFEHYAVGKSRRSIAQLMDIRPDKANVWRDNQLVETDPELVEVGEIIVVRPGERIPLDGVIAEGESTLDTAALTGESVPRSVQPGDDVISGCVNQTGVLHIEVRKPYGESTITRILELVENAASRKAKTENYITRFARYYTPCVVLAALLMAIVPSLVDGQWAQWVERALIFLVISCPCALVISVPLSYFGGIAGASRQGILIKGANYLESLAQVNTVVLDKTGTLTTGKFQVTEVHPQGISQEELLELAAYAESASSHPIAQGIREAYPTPLQSEKVEDIHEHAGHGVSAVVQGKKVIAGTAKYLNQMGIPCESTVEATIVHLAVDGFYAGYLVLADQVKPEAVESLRALKNQGVGKT